MKYLSDSEHHSSTTTWKKKGLKASITIYLTLTLVIILALVCTLIESGRVSAVKARLRSVTYMAADSVFAEFAQPMFDRFGIMGLWADEQEYLERFNSYVSKNLDIAGTGAGMDMDFYGMRYMGSELTGVSWLTDGEAKPFEDQVYEYMSIHAVEGMAEDVLTRFGYLEKTEKIRDVMGKVNEYQDEFVKAEKKASEIYDKAQHIKDLAENPKTLLEEMEQALDGYSEGDESQAEVFAEKKRELDESRKEISREISDMQEKTGEYYQSVDESSEHAGSLRDSIDIREEDFDPEIYQALMERVEAAESVSSENGTIYRQISDNSAAAGELQDKLNSMDPFFTWTEEDLNDENLQDYRALTGQYRTELEGVDLGKMTGGGAGTADTIRENGDFLITVNDVFNKGLLGFLAGDVSGKEIDQSTLPSKTLMKETTDNNDDIWGKTKKGALFSLYVTDHFGCFTDVRDDTALDYEIEYILGGKTSDKDNLSSALTWLVLLRFGMNLASLMTDGSKMAEISELAMAMIGWTGQLYLIKIAETLIMLSWGLAEAMLDVKTLLADRKVPLIKKQSDWFLSIEGLKNFSGDEGIGNDNANGIGYKDYLMIMLLLENKRNQKIRTMDMIQADLCVSENEAFRLKDCMVEADTKAAFTAPGVFASLPIVKRTFDAGSSGYQFLFEQEYGY